LMDLIRMRIGTPMSRPLWRDRRLEEAIEHVRLDWVAVSASIDREGTFGAVNGSALIEKLRAVAVERPLSGVRLAVISPAQQNGPNPIQLAPVDRMPGLFEFRDGLAVPLPVICADNAENCYRQLFDLQSQQVLL